MTTKMVDLVIKGVKIFIEDSFFEGGVVVNEGKIVAIMEERYLPEGKQIINGEGNYLIPGLIDTHVHFRDPATPERETFETGTKAAAAGGATTIFEGPVTIPPPYSAELIERRIKNCKPKAIVDFALEGAAGTKYLEHIKPCAEAGIIYFKTFFHSTKDRAEEFDGMTMENAGLQFRGFQEVSKTKKMLAIHCEDEEMVQTFTKELLEKGKVDAGAHSLARPPICEIEAVNKVLLFAKVTRLKIKFVHISTPEAMELIKKAKLEGQEVYLETCPHYLFLSNDDLIKHGPYAKVNPPLRSIESRDKLWDYIIDGTVDFIGTDHGPHSVSDKNRGFDNIFKASSGFPGIETRCPLMLTAVKDGRLSFKRAIDLMSTNPAKIFGLYPKKGTIRVGSDADFVLVDMKTEFVVDNKKMFTKARDMAVIYNGFKLVGKPIMTVVRGKVVFEKGKIMPGVVGWGNFLKGTI